MVRRDGLIGRGLDGCRRIDLLRRLVRSRVVDGGVDVGRRENLIERERLLIGVIDRGGLHHLVVVGILQRPIAALLVRLCHVVARRSGERKIVVRAGLLAQRIIVRGSLINLLSGIISVKWRSLARRGLSSVVRQGDDRWLNVVKWTHYAMVNAEELGVTQDSLSQAMASDKAEVQRLVGVYGGLGRALGLTNDWAVRIVRHVGNYGESFARNLGARSDFAIPRGLNALWDRGGIQYAPPIR